MPSLCSSRATRPGGVGDATGFLRGTFTLLEACFELLLLDAAFGLFASEIVCAGPTRGTFEGASSDASSRTRLEGTDEDNVLNPRSVAGRCCTRLGFRSDATRLDADADTGSSSRRTFVDGPAAGSGAARLAETVREVGVAVLREDDGVFAGGGIST